MNLSTLVSEIPRIGPVFQKKLKKLNVKTVRDLLFHFPHRYEDFSKIVPIAEAKANQTCSFLGKILEIKTSRTWKRKMFLTNAILEDKTGALKITWFNQPYVTKSLKAGDQICAVGKITQSKDGTYLASPAFEKISDPELDSSNLTHTGRIVPVYPETQGLSSRWLRYILKPLLLHFREKIEEALPLEIMRENHLLPIKKALWQIHFPDSLELAKEAQKRFSFEELFELSLLVLRERQRLNKEKAIPLPIKLDIIQDFVKSLPFKLTDAQKKSSWQILKDLEKPRPMNRLLEGDVGSGKTVVAMMACLSVIKNGFQVAFMAPTEILAKQHFQEVFKFLKIFNLNIGLLTGKEDKFYSKKLRNEVVEISRKKLLEKTRGEINPLTKHLAVGIDVLIGTHTLIQDKVKFGKLALVILDEQHRFGVEQRAKLLTKEGLVERKIPHLLSMTATPIPRTLALTIYGDLDLSLIDELPIGRKKIITQVVPKEGRQGAYDFIRGQVEGGRQAFVICPRIESADKSKKSEKGADFTGWAEVKAVKEEYEKLSKEIFPDLKIGMLHGKIAAKEKERIMKDFKNKKIDVLVATSVIEVGIDVPNATVMLVEGTERFGLAQLHQFRGRVGRSKYQSYCLLFTDSSAKKTHQRLKALISAENGFELAQKDLEIRGPGELIGQRQWGVPDLTMASLKNISLVEKVREVAKNLLAEDPHLEKYPALREKLGEFEKRIHLE